MGRGGPGSVEMLVMVGQGPVGVLVPGARQVGAVPMLRRCLCRGNGKRSLENLVGPSGGPQWIGADLVLMCVRGITMS
jgi:hypothetical protein